jgi:hypothetical protein
MQISWFINSFVLAVIQSITLIVIKSKLFDHLLLTSRHPRSILSLLLSLLLLLINPVQLYLIQLLIGLRLLRVITMSLRLLFFPTLLLAPASLIQTFF